MTASSRLNSNTNLDSIDETPGNFTNVVGTLSVSQRECDRQHPVVTLDYLICAFSAKFEVLLEDLAILKRCREIFRNNDLALNLT